MYKLIIPVFLLINVSVKAQSIQRAVIGSAGKTQTAGVITLRSTIGEVFTKTMSKSALTLQQGFQHGNLTLARMENNEVPSTESSTSTITEIALTIYPNPTTDVVHIQSKNEGTQLRYLVLDAEGKTVREQSGEGKEDLIDFTSLASGTYFLIAIDNEQQQRSSYKIIKSK